MPVTLIQSLIPGHPTTKKVEGDNKLAISEMFANTIQGEGVNAGYPATFIRLQGCTLKCTWCDTLDVWPHGNEYSFSEIIDLLSPFKEKYRRAGQHIILTGGSPLKQQTALVGLFIQLYQAWGFMPFIECENEAVLMPSLDMIGMVDVWNNSPKLSNSGMKSIARIRPEVLLMMSDLPNSWFKFVVQGEEDWTEITDDFLPYIKKEQIVLMPEGQTQDELNAVRERVIDLAVRVGVRYCDRLHVVAWNKRTGV